MAGHQAPVGSRMKIGASYDPGVVEKCRNLIQIPNSGHRKETPSQGSARFRFWGAEQRSFELIFQPSGLERGTSHARCKGGMLRGAVSSEWWVNGGDWGSPGRNSPG